VCYFLSSIMPRKAKSKGPPGGPAEGPPKSQLGTHELLTSRLKTKTAHFSKLQTVFRQGDACDCVMFIQSGTVKITVVNELGKEAVITLLRAGDFVGESCISNGSPVRLVTATAIHPTTVLVIQKAEMMRGLHDEKELAAQFITYMLRRNLRVESDLVDQMFNSTEKRLARALLLLAQYGREGTPQPAVAMIPQETLAEMVGTTRSRVNFFMNKFRKLGFIHYNGGLQVHSSLLSVVLHD
jgi:CRP/FNR family cyclic AMP-dependent transcriptional regulator